LLFDTTNIYNLTYEKQSFDSIIAIDSLHYLMGLDDILKMLRTLMKPGGMLYLFWESWIGDISNMIMKKPETTRLGIVLSELDMQFESWDFTDDNKSAWDSTVKNLKLFEDEFRKDDAELIYESRLSETSRIVNNIDSSRFLYKIRLN